MDVESIVAIAAAITGFLAGAAGLWKARTAQMDAATARMAASAAVDKSYVDGLIATLTAISQENARLRQCIENLEGDIKELGAGHAAGRAKLAELETALRKERDRIEELRADILALHEERRQAEGEIRSLRAENIHWKQRVQFLEDEIGRLRTKIDPRWSDTTGE